MKRHRWTVICIPVGESGFWFAHCQALGKSIKCPTAERAAAYCRKRNRRPVK